MNAGLWAVVMNAVPWAVGATFVAAAGIAYYVRRTRGDADAIVVDVAHAAELAAAFNRGVEAGKAREREAERERRSAAGTKAAATRRARSDGTVYDSSTPGTLTPESFAQAQSDTWATLEADASAPGRAD